MSAPPGGKTRQAALDLFRRAYAAEPTVVASAPGRVNLIGEHLDYNGGTVLPMAIDLRAEVAIGPASGTVSRAVSREEAGVGAFTIETEELSGSWWDYIIGVARQVTHLGTTPPAFHLAVASDIPRGGGLSSSAALEVASAGALMALADEKAGREEIARMAHRAEVEFVGVPCGIMDQFASALSIEGHALHLDAWSGDFEHVPMPAAVLVFDTAVPRSLRVSEFALRRKECEEALKRLRRVRPSLRNLASASLEDLRRADLPSPLEERARHVVEEVARVDEVVRALETGSEIPGELVYSSHVSLRDLYDCSSPELDWFVARMRRTPGIAGARLTGAGWGGCAMAVGHPDVLAEVATSVGRPYEDRYGRRPNVWISRAAEGLSVAPA